MTLKEYARRELSRLCGNNGDEYNYMIASDVMNLINKFCEQGHSNNSAPAVMSIFHRLAMYKPLGPLTGKEDEWGEWEDSGRIRFNKRCPAVWQKSNGKSFYAHGKVFVDKNGIGWENNESVIEITFPFHVPDKPERIHIDDSGNPIDPIKTFTDFEKIVEETRCYPEPDSIQGLIWSALALCGECGEVAEQIKRITRDDNSILTESRQQAIKKELGDVLFCLACIVRELNQQTAENALQDISLEDIFNSVAVKMIDRKRRNKLHGEGDNR